MVCESRGVLDRFDASESGGAISESPLGPMFLYGTSLEVFRFSSSEFPWAGSVLPPLPCSCDSAVALSAMSRANAWMRLCASRLDRMLINEYPLTEVTSLKLQHMPLFNREVLPERQHPVREGSQMLTGMALKIVNTLSFFTFF